MSERTKDRLIGVALVVGALLALGAFGVLCYAVAHANVNDLRWWALAATVALPIVGLAGWLLGKSGSRDHLAGLDQGIDRVMRAAGATAALRVNVLRATQQAKNPAPPTIIELPPEPDFVNVPQLGSGEGELLW